MKSTRTPVHNLAHFHPNLVPRHTPEQKRRENINKRLSVVALLFSIMGSPFMFFELTALTVLFGVTALLASLVTIKRVRNVQGRSQPRNFSVVAALISIHLLVVIAVMALGVGEM